MKPLVSIIIACFNGERHIREVIESVLNSSSQAYELIIVNDASTDSSVQIISTFLGLQTLTLITNQINIGPAASRNIGASCAKGDYLFFLDMDACLEQDAVRAIISSFESDQCMGGFQANIANAYTKKTESLGHYLTIFGFPYEVQDAALLSKGNYIFGAKTAGFGIRTHVFKTINGFENDYFIHGEDTDLAWRVWLAGYTMKCLLNTKIYHYSKGSLTKKTQYRIFYGGARNGTINIIKNASLQVLLPLLILHTSVWCSIGIKLIMERRTHLAWSIYRGLFWNLTHMPNMLKRRREIYMWAHPHPELKNIIYGRMTYTALIHKGLTWIQSS